MPRSRYVKPFDDGDDGDEEDEGDGGVDKEPLLSRFANQKAFWDATWAVAG